MLLLVTKQTTTKPKQSPSKKRRGREVSGINFSKHQFLLGFCSFGELRDMMESRIWIIQWRDHSLKPQCGQKSLGGQIQSSTTGRKGRNNRGGSSSREIHDFQKKREEVVGHQVKNTAGKMAPISLSKAPKNPLKKERGTKEFSQGYLMGRGKLLDKEFSGKSAWSS